VVECCLQRRYWLPQQLWSERLSVRPVMRSSLLRSVPKPLEHPLISVGVQFATRDTDRHLLVNRVSRASWIHRSIRDIAATQTGDSKQRFFIKPPRGSPWKTGIRFWTSSDSCYTEDPCGASWDGFKSRQIHLK
jgi:hypothetical protein